MKRKNIRSIAVVLALWLMLAGVPWSIQVEAEENTNVQYGTPTVDGVVDDIYRSSACVRTTTDDVFYEFGEIVDSEVDGIAYLLWDEDYLYVAVDVKDSTPTVCEIKEEYYWKHDSAECWFIDEGVQYVVHAAGDGNYTYAGGEPVYDFTASLHEAVMNDGGYVVEFALPMENLAEGREFGFSLQLNDIIAEDGANGYAAMYPGSKGGETLVCVAGAEATPSTESQEPEPSKEPESSKPAEQNQSKESEPIQEPMDQDGAKDAEGSNIVVIAIIVIAIVAVVVGVVIIGKMKKEK